MSDRAHGKIRTLLAYATLCYIGHLLLIGVYLMYLVIWLLLGEDGSISLGMQILYWAATALACAGNGVALHHLFRQRQLTSRRMRTVTVITAVLVAGYGVFAVVASDPIFAWGAMCVAFFLLPVAILFARPATLEAIRALPVGEDELYDFYDSDKGNQGW